jgi:hypothetical protein
MGMDLEFSGVVFEWRGPAPFYYVAVPDEESADIQAIADAVTYGWGVIPVTVRVGGTTWETSLFPKDGRYLVPLKARIREAEGIGLDDEVAIAMKVGG